jgi:hypothetical protein
MRNFVDLIQGPKRNRRNGPTKSGESYTSRWRFKRPWTKVNKTRPKPPAWKHVRKPHEEACMKWKLSMDDLTKILQTLKSSIVEL